MSNTHLKSALIGGLIVFIWGLFSWMVFPWHQSCLNRFTNESRVAEVILDNAPQSGVYVLPNTFSYNEGTSQKEINRGMNMMDNGPFMFAAVKTNGLGQMTAGPFVLSLILQVVGAYIVIWMLMQTKGMAYKRQLAFVTLFGFSIGILGQLPDWNWWGFSPSYVMTNILDLVVGWFLASLAIVKLMKKH